MPSSWLSRNCTHLVSSGLHLAFQYWLKQLVHYPFSLLHIQLMVFAGPRAAGEDGSGTCHIIWVPIFFPFLFSLLNPTSCIITPILKFLFFFILLTSVKLSPQIQFEQEIDNPMHYKTQLNFYFETHLYHRGGGKLKLSPTHSLLSPFGVLESALGFRSGTFLIFRLHPYREPLRHPQL